MYSLVPLLLKSEEENYQIFHTINELNTELEQVCLGRARAGAKWVEDVRKNVSAGLNKARAVVW